jgi:hypothetical protein
MHGRFHPFALNFHSHHRKRARPEKITLVPAAAALSKLLVFYHKTGIAVYPQRSKKTEYRRLRVIIE